MKTINAPAPELLDSLGLYTRILSRCNQRGLPDAVTYALARRAGQRQQEAQQDFLHTGRMIHR